MKKKNVVVALVSFVLVFSIMIGAGHCTEQEYEFKWLQEPDTNNGFDIWSWGYEDPQTAGGVIIVNEVADDWVCQEGRNITDVHWYGSFKGYKNDTMGVPQGGTAVAPPPEDVLPMYFILSMHKDVPETAGP